MARNIKPAATESAPATDIGQPGGSPGMPDDPNPMAVGVGGPQVAPGARAASLEPREDKAPRRFRVVGGPGRADEKGGFRAMYDGALTTVRLGSVYAEHQTDLDALRRQGFTFEAVSEMAG